MLLWMLLWPSQIGLSPQYGDACIGSFAAEGVPGFVTGCLIWNARCFTGSSAGTRSVLSSGAP
jgi:hypothetical protein